MEPDSRINKKEEFQGSGKRTRGVSELTSLKSYVDDTRVQRTIAEKADCDALQADLQSIYNWAEEVAMVFNNDKFEALRYWPGRTLQPSTP